MPLPVTFCTIFSIFSATATEGACGTGTAVGNWKVEGETEVETMAAICGAFTGGAEAANCSCCSSCGGGG
jgi:hypothetical protein